jgi:hypothetical protein
MNEKVNLFFVETPLQLISATQARDSLNIYNASVFINVKDKSSNNHMQIIDELDNKWDEIHFICKRQRYLKHVLYVMMLFKLFIKYKNNVERFFYGEYRSLDYAIYESIISPNESILLDDGSITIAIQKNYIQKRKNIFEVKGLKANIFKKILSKCRTPNLFSFFDLRNNMLPEQINYCCQDINVRSVSIIDCFYFVGSKLSEAGYMSRNDELSILSVIFKQFKCSDFYYIPHRGESNEKLTEIEAIGYKLKILNQPLETFYKATAVMPKYIISYYSTALYTCYLTFGAQVNIVAVDVRKYLTSRVSLHNVDTVYDYYLDIGITIKAL